MKNIAIIPARGGSKRIPKKNIKSFFGLPAISRTIKIAQESELFTHIIVSTDDDAIAEIAINAGALVPFIRSKELSDDHTSTLPVILNAIKECESLKIFSDNYCCIYPTSCLIQIDDLRNGFDLLKSNTDFYVHPVTEYSAPIQWALKKSENGHLEFLHPENELVRSQDFKAYYYDAGQFYWASKNTWLSGKRIHSNAIGLNIPNWRVVDIDTQNDWERAELIYKFINDSK